MLVALIIQIVRAVVVKLSAIQFKRGV